jgi:hypothetical protein
MIPSENRNPSRPKPYLSRVRTGRASYNKLILVPAWIGGTLISSELHRNSSLPTCQAISSNDHIVLILMYRRPSFMDITKTYPAKINPAVPRTFRTTLSVLIAPTFWPNWHPALMLSAPKRKCFSRRSRFRQTKEYTPGVCGPILRFRRGGGGETDSADAAGEIGKAKYRGRKNRNGFNRARSALSG